ncbi:hypothetical protein SAMN05660443_0544 [Marinospirillum celere]|uniref:DUF2946 domain-containing protein n=1 Tax=Marinospirillum celere TaxID=1122252 RepID=A0A1I1EFI0_9GAMM|nr:hypothetical protein SAMN05660443_0544 [Marinospirillum celere]
MPRNRSLANTLFVLLMLAVISGRVLFPFNQPPLQVHADGSLEICSWQGSGERLFFSPDGEPLESKTGPSLCPACILSTPVTGPSSLNLSLTPGSQNCPTPKNLANLPTDLLPVFLARAPPSSLSTNS